MIESTIVTRFFSHRGSDFRDPRPRPLLSGFMALAMLFGFGTASAQSEPSPTEMVNALNELFGRHAKQRSSHAKGFCVAGSFEPTSTASEYLSSPLVRVGKVPVTGRFSIGGGNPQASDRGRSVRGFAIRFHISDRETLDLVLISAPTFFASTPAQFVEFLKVRTPNPITGEKDPQRIQAFNRANPNVLPHLNYVSQTPPPASYATTPYFSTHAFLFDQPDNGTQAARWIVEPTAGRMGLTPEQEQSMPNNFLEDEFTNRLRNHAVSWNVYLQIPLAEDSITDPSAVWPETRKKIHIGTLVIDTKLSNEAALPCERTIFDPNRLPTGITATEDPILAIRSPAYGVSFGRRSQ